MRLLDRILLALAPDPIDPGHPDRWRCPYFIAIAACCAVATVAGFLASAFFGTLLAVIAGLIFGVTVGMRLVGPVDVGARRSRLRVRSDPPAGGRPSRPSPPER